MEAFPQESCGLLIGRETPSGTIVRRVERARNVTAGDSTREFTIDPTDWMHIESAARRDGLDVVGVWHSHPNRMARPSRADFTSAWNGYSYCIARVTDEGLKDLRAWRRIEEVFLEQQVLDQRN